MNASFLAAPRYQIQLTRLDLDPLLPAGEPMGLARGRVVGLRTATAFLESDDAARVMDEWLIGGTGDRPSRWRAAVVLQQDEPVLPPMAG